MTDFEAARVAMVDRQVRTADVTSYPIIEAMLWAPRERFAPSEMRPVCYAGEHIELAERRVLLDPRTFAKMVNVADVGADDLVLDIGCGLGYSAAVLGRLAGAVVAVESDESMARHAAAALQDLEALNVAVETGDLASGAPATGPYNVIFINGGVERLPEGLTDQLRDDGRLVAIHMDGEFGRACVTLRTGDRFSTRRAFDAAAPVLPGFEKAREFVF